MESESLFEITKAFSFLNEGGIFMWLIFLLSVVATAVAIERIYFLYIRNRFSADHFYRQLRTHLLSGERDKAYELSKSVGDQPLARVLSAGLRPELKNSNEVNRAMETEALFQAPRLTQRINFLSTFANAATLLGLLGTIAGLIASFNGLAGAAASGLSKEEALAAGISVAMYTTAFGLIVAIPTMLTYVILSSRAQKILTDLDHYASALNRDLFNPFIQEESTVNEKAEVEESVEEQVFSGKTELVAEPKLSNRETEKSFLLNEDLEQSLAETRLRQSALDRKMSKVGGTEEKLRDSVLDEITKPYQDQLLDEESDFNSNLKTEVTINPTNQESGEDLAEEEETNSEKDVRITGVKSR